MAVWGGGGEGGASAVWVAEWCGREGGAWGRGGRARSTELEKLQRIRREIISDYKARDSHTHAHTHTHTHTHTHIA